MKRKMTCIVLGLTTLLMVGSTTAVSAYTKSNFSCTATKLMDGESTHIKKYAGSTKAETTVSSMTKKENHMKCGLKKEVLVQMLHFIMVLQIHVRKDYLIIDLRIKMIHMMQN